MLSLLKIHSMRILIVHILLLFSLMMNAQFYKTSDKIKYPDWSLAAGASYMGESGDFGTHFKFCIPTQNGINLYYQSLLVPPTASNGNLFEYRMEGAMEITFLKISNFSTFAVGGYSAGYWKYQKAPLNTHHYTVLHKDQSFFYGGGVNYDFNFNWAIYSAYKVYPSIYSSYAELGVKYNFYYKKPKKRKRGKVLKTTR